ncbi:DIA2 [Candida oxycetoniae]|uniref:DIA2 n=1 Tax=Candida oxycetoniae TaxID=497107 RepID=A0AAI9WVU7_9ASCO|nr:DIA2 [Candida oxycetoniae]KAI3402605.2 DIA2 [Candida oxycetoniae]
MDNEEHRAAVVKFKGGDYVGALSLFNKLIYKVKQSSFITDLPLGTLLDQRAATYEKLGQYNLALKDGRTLIERDPGNCKGYLRVGKLLCLLERKFEAYKVYQEGIYVIGKLKMEKKQMKNFNQGLFLSLKQQYKLINTELKEQRTHGIKRTASQPMKIEPIKRTAFQSMKIQSSSQSDSSQSDSSQKVKRVKSKLLDPFLYLSPEIIASIFRLIPESQIYKCLLVSQTWYCILLSLPELYNFDCKRSITYEEYSCGLTFFKKVASYSTSKEIKRIKINNVAKQKITQVLLSLVKEPQAPILSIDVSDSFFNLQLFFAVMAKANWRLNNFQKLQSLKLGINCSIKYPHILLNLFPRLKELEISIILPENSLMSLVPIHDKKFKQLKENKGKECNLEKLKLVNHHQLLKREGVAISAQTYSPFPVLLDHRFPSLTELTLVSFNFSNHLPQFGTFLASLDKLTTLYLENNDGIDLLTILQVFLNYQPKFKLKSFTLRENCITSSIPLQQVSESYLTQFTNLNTLDLYGNCLTNSGLFKILKVCGNKLVSLNIGNSYYLTFALHSPKQLYIKDIINLCPNLSFLYLNEMNIDSAAMLQLPKNFGDNLKVPLKYLDLSFNQFEGIDLIRFLASIVEKLEGYLETLVVHGLPIKEDTLTYLKKKRWVLNCISDPQRARWRIANTTETNTLTNPDEVSSENILGYSKSRQDTSISEAKPRKKVFIDEDDKDDEVPKDTPILNVEAESGPGGNPDLNSDSDSDSDDAPEEENINAIKQKAISEQKQEQERQVALQKRFKEQRRLKDERNRLQQESKRNRQAETKESSSLPDDIESFIKEQHVAPIKQQNTHIILKDEEDRDSFVNKKSKLEQKLRQLKKSKQSSIRKGPVWVQTQNFASSKKVVPIGEAKVLKNKAKWLNRKSVNRK